jgi:hypothetical protein
MVQRLVSPRLFQTTCRGRHRRRETRKALKCHSIPPEPTEKKRVQKGGSFLCTDQYCTRYMVGTRGKGEVNTGTNHLGFRCALEGHRMSVSAASDEPSNASRSRAAIGHCPVS